MLVATGRADRGEYGVPDRYGPKNWLFLAHELQIRDVRGWLARVGRTYPHHPGLVSWTMGKAAWLDVEGGQLRPDASFAYRLPNNTLFRFVEVDRGTEKAPARWEDKCARYLSLLPDRERMKELTGYEIGRVLVIAPNLARRDQLWEWLTGWTQGRPEAVDRFWIAERDTLQRADLSVCGWRVAGRPDLMALVAPSYL